MSESVLYLGLIARSSVMRRELAALVDADAERLFLGDVDLDPAAALGNDAAARQLAVARPVLLHHEIDARAAVQLAHHHALGAVDDELAAAEHDRNVAQIDLFLDRLLFVQSQPNAERLAVGQAQLAAFFGRVARLAQFVAQVLELDRLVVALDREDFAQHAFQAVVFALFRRRLPPAGRPCSFRSGSSVRSGNDVGFASAAEAADFFGGQTPLCGSGHSSAMLREIGQSTSSRPADRRGDGVESER